MTAFLSPSPLDLGEPHVSDRTGDMGSAIVWTGNASIHINDAATARALKEAFAEAERLLEAAGRTS